MIWILVNMVIILWDHVCHEYFQDAEKIFQFFRLNSKCEEKQWAVYSLLVVTIVAFRADLLWEILHRKTILRKKALSFSVGFKDINNID